MSIEAMKLTDPHDHPEPHTTKWTRAEMDYINRRVEAAVRAAIEQAEKQEPVAIVVDAYDTPGLQWLCQHPPNRGKRLYPAPPQRSWQGLVKGVRVDGDNVIVFAGNNDAARELCGALLEEKNDAA